MSNSAWQGGKKWRIGTVKWQAGAFVIATDKGDEEMLFYNVNLIKIIGNVWENPELIK